MSDRGAVPARGLAALALVCATAAPAWASLPADRPLLDAEPEVLTDVYAQPATGPLPSATVACLAPLLQPRITLPGESDSQTAELILPGC